MPDRDKSFRERLQERIQEAERRIREGDAAPAVPDVAEPDTAPDNPNEAPDAPSYDFDKVMEGLQQGKGTELTPPEQESSASMPDSAWGRTNPGPRRASQQSTDAEAEGSEESEFDFASDVADWATNFGKGTADFSLSVAQGAMPMLFDIAKAPDWALKTAQELNISIYSKLLGMSREEYLDYVDLPFGLGDNEVVQSVKDFMNMDLADRPAYQLASDLQQSVDETLQEAKFDSSQEAREKFWTSQIPEGLGSMGSYILLGVLTGGGGAVSKAPKAATKARAAWNYLRNLGREMYRSPATYVAASGAGIRAYDESERSGQDESTSLMTGAAATPSGAIQVANIVRLTSKLNKATNGGFQRGLINVLKEGAASGANETLAEGSGVVLYNTAMKLSWDEDRELWDGLYDSAVSGGTVGAISGLLLGAVGARRNRLGQLEQADDPAAEFKRQEEEAREAANERTEADEQELEDLNDEQAVRRNEGQPGDIIAFETEEGITSGTIDEITEFGYRYRDVDGNQGSIDFMDVMKVRRPKSAKGESIEAPEGEGESVNLETGTGKNKRKNTFVSENGTYRSEKNDFTRSQATSTVKKLRSEYPNLRFRTVSTIDSSDPLARSTFRIEAVPKDSQFQDEITNEPDGESEGSTEGESDSSGSNEGEDSTPPVLQQPVTLDAGRGEDAVEVSFKGEGDTLVADKKDYSQEEAEALTEKFNKEYPNLNFETVSTTDPENPLSKATFTFQAVPTKKAEGKTQSSTTQSVESRQTVARSIEDGKQYRFNGYTGTLRREGRMVVLDANDTVYEIGNINEIGTATLADMGIEQAEGRTLQVADDYSVEIDGTTYYNGYSNPATAINYDKDGNVKSVSLDTEDGKRRNIRGSQAEEIAYQYELIDFDKNAREEEINEALRQAQEAVRNAGAAAGKRADKNSQKRQGQSAGQQGDQSSAEGETVSEDDGGGTGDGRTEADGEDSSGTSGEGSSDNSSTGSGEASGSWTVTGSSSGTGSGEGGSGSTSGSGSSSSSGQDSGSSGTDAGSSSDNGTKGESGQNDDAQEQRRRQQQELEDIKKEAERNAGEGNAVGNFNKKFRDGKQLYGRREKYTTEDGTVRDSIIMVVEADDIEASHNEYTFAKTPGFPVDKNGSTVNDNDYSKKSNRERVVEITKKLTPVTLFQKMPIISRDGLVISGNNRTMSFKRARGDNKKAYAKYQDELVSRAEQFGINPDDVRQMKSPFFVRMDLEASEYTLKEFARHNAEDKKQKSPVARAVNMAKMRTERLVKQLGEIIERRGKETIRAALDDRAAAKSINALLIEEGIYESNEAPQFYDSDAGQFTTAGKDVVESVARASILEEAALYAGNESGMKQFMNLIDLALPALIRIRNLAKVKGQEYDIAELVNAAVMANLRKVQQGLTNRDLYAQQGMFAEDAISPEVAFLHHLISKSTVIDNLFKQTVLSYLRSIESSGGMFGEAQDQDRDSIFRQFIEREAQNLQFKLENTKNDKKAKELENELKDLQAVQRIEKDGRNEPGNADETGTGQGGRGGTNRNNEAEEQSIGNGKKGSKQDKFYFRSALGYDTAPGEWVDVPGFEGIDTFVYQDTSSGEYVLVEARTGLDIIRGDTKQDAIDNGRQQLIISQVMGESRNGSVFSYFNEKLSENNGRANIFNAEKYGDLSPSLSSKDKIEAIRKHLATTLSGDNIELKRELEKLEAAETTPEEIPGEQQKPDKTRGEDNKIFTKSEYEKAKERIKKRLGQANAGIDPQLLIDGITVAGFHIESGARKFRDYARVMIEDFGDDVRPYLQQWYEAARRDPGFKNSGIPGEMTPTAEVDAVDIDTEDFSQEDSDTENTTTESNSADELSQEPGGMLSYKWEPSELYSFLDQLKKDFKPFITIRREHEGKQNGTLSQYSLGTENFERNPVDGRKHNKVYFYMNDDNDVEPGFFSETETVGSYKGKQIAAQQLGILLEQAVDALSSKVVPQTFDRQKLQKLQKVVAKYAPYTRADYGIQTDKMKVLNDAIDTQLTKLEEGNGPQRKQFKQRIKSLAISGNGALTKSQLEKIAADFSYSQNDTKLIKEDAEAGLVIAAQDLAEAYKDQPDRAYKALVKLYENQPYLTDRTSTSIQKQQYSTPIPAAYLLGRYVELHRGVAALEPSAGNGLLTIAAGNDKSNIRVNEIDEQRYDNLTSLGYYETTKADGSLADTFRNLNKTQQAVITNPPFGATEQTYPFTVEKREGELTKLDHVMSALALDTMRDDGKAALIIGGKDKPDPFGKRRGEDASFFHFLHHHYNVEAVINLAGNMYKKQGTTFPTRLILINGRKKTPAGYAPNVKKPVRAETFQQLRELIEPFTKETQNEIIQQTGLDTDNSSGTDTGGSGGRRGGNNDGRTSGSTGGGATGGTRTGGSSGGRGSGSGSGGSSSGGGGSSSGTGNTKGDSTGSNDDRQDGDTTSDGERTGGDGPSDTNPQESVDTRRVDGTTQRADGSLVRRIPERRLLKAENGTVPYLPVSSSPSIQTQTPASMAESSYAAYQNLVDEVGNIDDYVVEKAGFKSKKEMQAALAGEQVDAVANAIYQAERGKALIVGDQTGIGKGRVAAAMIKYAKHQGLTPVFFTEKDNLFSDMHRDLTDIGESLRPFIVNSGSSVKDQDGRVVHKMKAKEQREAIKNVEISGYDYVAVTYSQISSTKATQKRDFLESLSPNAIFILDEAHNASGTSNTGEFMATLLNNAKGATYLSATFAKRADNMPIYALKTDIQDAGISNEMLTAIINSSGVVLQEVLSADLVRSGQMVRRQRSFEGVKREFKAVGLDQKGTPDKEGVKQRKLYDEVAVLMRDLVLFQKTYVDPILKAMNKEAKDGMLIDKRKGTRLAGVDNTPFASRVHNIVDQLLFSIKVDKVAEETIDVLKQGKKPIVAVKSTMEAVLRDSLENGEPVPEFGFGTVMERALKGVMKYTKRDPIAKENVPDYVDYNELHPQGKAEYNRIVAQARQVTSELSASPIDRLTRLIKDAGYDVVETTGRSLKTAINDKGEIELRTRSKQEKDKNTLFRKFNNTESVAMILNSSGATGASAHSSPNFDDTSQRVMIIHQPELNINTEVQKWGRIFRTGQLNKPEYRYITTAVPAESRLMMILKKKIKSLDANTTSSQKQTGDFMESADFINKYGDLVVVEYLKENKSLYYQLDAPVNLAISEDKNGNRSAEAIGAARKVSGRVAMLDSETQEQFYNDVTERYNAYVEDLQQLGKYDLEMDYLDLQAEVQSRTVVVEGEVSGSIFGGDTYVDEVRSKMQQEPLSKAAIDKEVAEIAEGNDPVKHATDLFEKAKAHYLKKYNDTVKAIDASSRSLDYKQEAKEKAREELDYKTAVVRSVFKDFQPGNYYKLPVSGEVVDAVFLGFKISKTSKNPYTPSAIKLSFGTNTGHGIITLSGNTSALGTASSLTASVPADRRQRKIDNWDENVSTDTRETRYIIGGNILKSVEKSSLRGRIVKYTDNKGQIKTGVLLPKGLSEKELKEIRSKELYPAEPEVFEKIKNVSVWQDIELTKGVRISRNNRQELYISVPASKSKGGKFFLDDTLLEKLGRDFVRKSGRMRAVIDNQQILSDILDYIGIAKGVRYVEEKKQAAQDGDTRFQLPENPFDLDAESGRLATTGRETAAMASLTNDSPNAERPALLQPSEMEQRYEDLAYPSEQTREIASELRTRVERMPDNNIRIAESIRDLPEALQSIVLRRRNMPTGLWHDGISYVLAFNQPDAETAWKTVLHETVGHGGMRGLVNMMAKGDKTEAQKELNALHDEVYQTYKDDPRLNRIARRYEYDLAQKEDQRKAAEELIAKLAENVENRGLLNRIADFLRKIARKIGVTGKLTDSDLYSLLADARKVAHGRSPFLLPRPARSNPGPIALYPNNDGEGGIYRESVPESGDRATDILYKSDAPTDKEYLEAVANGDMEKAQAMVDGALQESGLMTFEAPDVSAYSVRRGKPPENTRKAYKAFRMVDGTLRPLYVGATDALPTGVWLDAKAGGTKYRNKKNGRLFIYSGSGKTATGDSFRVDDVLDNESLQKFREKHGDRKTGKFLAYRPGWHTGTLPYNPQGAGQIDKQYDKKNPTAEHPYRHKLYENIVIAEVELAADKDYQQAFEETAARTKDGRIKTNMSGLKSIPEDGYYNYTTNANNNDLPGDWLIGGSLKIGRVLSQEESDAVMQQQGSFPQQRVAPLDLEALGYDGTTDAGKKLRDPVTYDDNGNVIPLSERFNPDKADVRYSLGNDNNALSKMGTYYPKSSDIRYQIPETDADGEVAGDGQSITEYAEARRVPGGISRLTRLKGFFMEPLVWFEQKSELKPLADAVRNYYDKWAARRGKMYGRVYQRVLRPLQKLSKKEQKKVIKQYEEYMRMRETGHTEQAEMLETLLHPVAKEMLSYTRWVAQYAGDINEILDVKVYDPKLKRYRPIGRVQEFFPRKLNSMTRAAMRNPHQYAEHWNNLVEALIDEGFVDTKAEADKYLQFYLRDYSENNYFAGVEKARGKALPSIAYDYSFDVMLDYTNRWSERIAQIEFFGQETDPKTDPDLFGEFNRKVADESTRELIEYTRQRVYNRNQHTTFYKTVGTLNKLASGSQLGNPGTATLNLIGGTTLNFMAFPTGSNLKALAKLSGLPDFFKQLPKGGPVAALKELNQLSDIIQDGRMRGAITTDMVSLLRDTDNVEGFLRTPAVLRALGVKDSAIDTNDLLNKYVNFSLKYGGYLPTEMFIRSHAQMTAKYMLQEAFQHIRKNPASRKSLLAIKQMQQYGFDYRRLMEENGQGSYTDRYIRRMANLTQGSYKVDQVPVHMDTPIGRFFFKYVKFISQATRLFYLNAFKPFMEGIAKGGTEVQVEIDGEMKSKRVADFTSMLRFLVAGTLGGELVAGLRDYIFDYFRAGPEEDELEKALEDDDYAKWAGLMVERAFWNLQTVGGLTIFGNYWQLTQGIFNRQRSSNPLSPAGWSVAKNTIELGQTAYEQGGLSMRDMDYFLQRQLSAYRTTRRPLMKALHSANLDIANQADEYNYTLNRNYVRSLIRRWEDAEDISGARTIQGRIARTPNSPMNAKLHGAISVNEPERAAAIFLREAEGRPGKLSSMAQSARSSMRYRQPKGNRSERRFNLFLKWAEDNVPEASVNRLKRIQQEYAESYQKFSTYLSSINEAIGPIDRRIAELEKSGENPEEREQLINQRKQYLRDYKSIYTSAHTNQ